MKIIDLEKGMRLESAYLVSKVNKGITQNGAPYLSITLQDSSGEIEGKYWDVADDQEDLIQVGRILLFKADVLMYRQNLQLRIRQASVLSKDEYDLEDFVKTGDFDEAFLKNEIVQLVNSIDNKIIKDIVLAAFDFYGDRFFQYPAATRNHHDFVGGLASHVYTMAQVGNALCDIYPIYNRDLVIAGILLHDMGKIEEYSAPMLSEYTAEGRLIGHISIIHARLVQIIDELGYGDEEESLLLRHMVLSHHGKMEYGSPVVPMLKEAELLHFIDNLDARSEMFKKFYGDQEEGSFSPRMFALNNRNFYKAKGVK